MRIAVVFAIGLSLVLSACGGGKKDVAEQEKAKGQAVDEKGRKVDIYSGGIFKMNQVSKPTTLFPHGVGELTGHNIANQVYEGLVKLNQATLKVEPCLAETYEVNDDGTVFTYHLRKGVMFHDDPCFSGGKGREMTANDVKYCLDQLCTPYTETKTKKNDLGGLVISKIKGAQAYYDSFESGSPMEGGVEGVKVIDDYTLEITLETAFAGFNGIMSTPAGWVFPKEAVEHYGEDMRDNPVGTGPFMKKNVDLSKSVYLQRNENYWDVDEHGNKLPYLEILKFTFMSEKKTEFQAFNKGELDMVWKIPIDELNNVLQDLNDAQDNAQQYLQSADALSIQFYGFLNTHEVFKDIRVRKAFNMAIDREELVRSTLYGEGTPADYGIVPAIDGYPQENIKGFEHNPEEARKLLAEAGYPNGEGFPTIELHINNDGNVNMMLATAIQNQLFENLGVTIEPKQMTLNQLRRKFESGNSALWRTAWVADYPSPENYLNLFHSKHIPDDPSESTFYNAYRYSNPEFDRLYDEAVKTLDDAERMALFAKADQILIDDAVVMPIYYDSYERLMSRKVKNFPINGMEYRDFTRVFLNEEE